MSDVRGRVWIPYALEEQPHREPSMSADTSIRAGVCLALHGFVFASLASAAPTDGVIRGGAATIAQSGSTTTINQSSARAVIDWRAFDIAAGETVTFVQPTAQSAVLNRVTGNQFSSLRGALSANGQVFLVNPNGVLI